MNQTNTVTGTDIALRVLVFCTLLIGGGLVIANYSEVKVTECRQVVTQEAELSAGSNVTKLRPDQMEWVGADRQLMIERSQLFKAKCGSVLIMLLSSTDTRLLNLKTTSEELETIHSASKALLLPRFGLNSDIQKLRTN